MRGVTKAERDRRTKRNRKRRESVREALRRIGFQEPTDEQKQRNLNTNLWDLEMDRNAGG